MAGFYVVVMVLAGLVFGLCLAGVEGPPDPLGFFLVVLVAILGLQLSLWIREQQRSPDEVISVYEKALEDAEAEIQELRAEVRWLQAEMELKRKVGALRKRAPPVPPRKAPLR